MITLPPLLRRFESEFQGMVVMTFERLFPRIALWEPLANEASGWIVIPICVSAF